MTRGLVPAHHRTAAEVDYRGVKYDMFNNGMAILHAMGYVLPVNAIHNFIDNHL